MYDVLHFVFIILCGLFLNIFLNLEVDNIKINDVRRIPQAPEVIFIFLIIKNIIYPLANNTQGTHRRQLEFISKLSHQSDFIPESLK